MNAPGEKKWTCLNFKPSYLIEIMGERRCIVINIFHQYCYVSLSLVLGVRGSDSQGVPRLLLKVQRGGEWNASTVAVNPKLAQGCRVQMQRVGEGRTGVDIITRHKSDLCADQHVWLKEKDSEHETHIAAYK